MMASVLLSAVTLALGATDMGPVVHVPNLGSLLGVNRKSNFGVDTHNVATFMGIPYG